MGACSPKIIAPAKPPTLPPVVEKPSELKKDSIPKSIEPANKQMIISLVLPFGLETIEISTAKLSQISKANLALDYYLGFKMALDSVANLYGGDFKLQVFDSSDDVKKVNPLILEQDIKNSNLIVGPVFPNSIKTFSALSKSLKIPLVSPLAPSNPNTFNNPYLLTINNTLNQHAYAAALYIKETLKPKKVLLFRSGQVDEFKYAIPFKKGMDSLANEISFSEIGIKAIGYTNIAQYLSATGLNVIVLPATNASFLETMLKELVKLSLTFKIAVIGHPNWEKTDFLNIETLQKLNTYITSSCKIDYRNFEVNIFVKNFRKNYNQEPSEYSFKGFDTGFYLASLMIKNSKNYFLNLDKSTYNGLHNQFKFIKSKQFGYFNSSIMILKYQNFELIKQN